MHSNPLYAHLISHAADLEPRWGGFTWDYLPELKSEDVQLICSVEPQRVMDNLDVTTLVLDVATAKNPAVRLPQLIEQACRQVLFYDVEVECLARDEQKEQDRAQTRHNRLAGYA
jgi:hypothetical protein